jgi:ABC-2 type transport system ATP-binding protein
MGVIVTQGLTKYYGKARGIIDLNLEVQPGEVFGFIGPNGAGKSTTIKTLLNFLQPTGGKAEIFGLDVVRDTVAIKQRIGYVPAEVSYYDDMTARKLLEYSERFYGSGCSARRAELSDILGVELDRRIEDLSLGNRRKVAIVQALQHQPDLIILDEATSGLDPLVQAKFFEVLQAENKRGATVFFSSHNLDEVQRICDRVGIIKEGRLVSVEEVEKLRGSQYKKVRVESHGNLEALLRLPGVKEAHVEATTVEFLYAGKIDALVKAMALVNVQNVWFEDPSLEEIFMHYYREDGE